MIGTVLLSSVFLLGALVVLTGSLVLGLGPRDSPVVLLGALVAGSALSGLAYGLWRVVVWWSEWRLGAWAQRNASYLEELTGIGVDVHGSSGRRFAKSLAAAGDAPSVLAEWIPLGAANTLSDWRFVKSSGVSVEEARRWHNAGLDAMFAAAAARCGAELADVLELVAAYQAGLARKGEPAEDAEQLWSVFCWKSTDPFGPLGTDEIVLAKYVKAPRQKMLAALRAFPDVYQVPLFAGDAPMEDLPRLMLGLDDSGSRSAARS